MMKYMEKDKSKKYGNQQNSLMVRYMTLILVKNLNGIRVVLEHGIWDISQARNIENCIKITWTGKFQRKNFLKNTGILIIIYHSQDNQIEVINMKKNCIFSIVRNGLYEQYLKLITNIDVNCQNEYGQNLLQEAIVSNMDEIAIDLVKNSCGSVWELYKYL